MLLNSQDTAVNTMPMESQQDSQQDSQQHREQGDWSGCFNQRLLDRIPDAVYLYDLVDQRTLFATRSIADLLGYSESEVQAMQDVGLAHLIHPADLEIVASHFQNFTVLPAGVVIEILYRMKRADGQWCWLRSREVPFIQAIDGYPLQIFGTVQEMTDTAQGGSFWRSGQPFLNQAVSGQASQIEEMVMITDRQGVIQAANQKFEQITGYSRAEILGKTPAILKSGQHPPDFYRHLWHTLESGQVFRGSFINRGKRGDLFHADQTIVPLRNGAGEITHFLAIGQEVSEYWQA